MATRRSPSEIAEALKSRAAQLEADAERRLSVASDGICSYVWDAECSVHRARLATTNEAEASALAHLATNLKTIRLERWKREKPS